MASDVGRRGSYAGWLAVVAALALAVGPVASAHAQQSDTESGAAASDMEPEPVAEPAPVAEPTPPSTSASTASSSSTTTSTSTTTPRSTSTHPVSTSTTSTTSATTPRTAPTEDEPEPEGDGRDVDFIWLEVEGGVSYVNLVAFRNANFAGGDTDVFREVTGTGPMVGAAAGFRIYWLAIGARVTFASYQVFQIGTVGADVQLRFPIPIFEPYIRVGAGYAWEGEASYSNPAMSSTNVSGWSFDAALGFDIFLTNWLTIGAGAGFDLLNMTRQRDPSQPCMGVTDFCPMRDGDSIGFQIRGFAQAALHF
jgi:hypothetical protein